MKEKIKYYLKPLLISALAVIGQLTIYKLSVVFQNNPTLIGNNIDNKIPFIIYFIIPYTIWYILLFLMPIIIHKKDKKDFTRYIITYLSISLFADIIYIIYPTTIIRPEITNTPNILYSITKIIFTIDTPIRNCFPSLHCAVSTLWILFILEKNKYNTKTKIITILINILIILSTLFIKQHVLIDAISGILLAIIIYYIIKQNKTITNKLHNKLSKIFKY